MKWIGQHIYDLVSRFRNDVYLEDSLLTLKSTDTTTNLASELRFKKDAADTEDDENLGTITFHGENESNADTKFAHIKAKISESDAGAEGGKLLFAVASHDGEMRNGLQIIDGNLEDEIDVAIAGGTSSITTIAGTLSMGLTATLSNAGLLQVANQTGITGLGTITSGTWQGTAIASAYLDADTAHLSGVQTFTGTKTFSASIGVQSTLNPKILVSGDGQGTSGDGAAIHVDLANITDTNTSASGTAAKFTHVNIEPPRLLAANASVTTTDAATLYVNGAPSAHTNQTITNSWSLWVDSGNARFDGSIYSGTTEAINSSGLLTVANQSNITGVGTITSGTWRGTAIEHEKIGADAVEGDNIADNAVDSEHYTDGSIDTVHIADDQVTFAKASGVTPKVFGSVIKLIPSDFMDNGDGGNTKFGVAYTDVAGTGYGMRPPNNATELYAFVSIPEGMKAVSVHIYDKNDLAIEVFEAQIDATTMTSKGTGNCGTTLTLSSEVNSSATNFLAIEVTTTSVNDRVYGGIVTIAAQ